MRGERQDHAKRLLKTYEELPWALYFAASRYVVPGIRHIGRSAQLRLAFAFLNDVLLFEERCVKREEMETIGMAERDRRPTILLVDDHPSIRLILSAGLKAHGFDVLLAATAEKAMALCKAFDGPIDVMLADVGLTPQEVWSIPGTDDSISHGVALAEQVMHLRPQLKIVLFTGYSDERLQRLGAATDRFQLLRKPCSLPMLIQTFRTLLQPPSEALGSHADDLTERKRSV